MADFSPRHWGFRLLAAIVLALPGLALAQAAPVANSDTATMLAGGTISIPVTANDSGDITGVAISTTPTFGVAVANGLNINYTALNSPRTVTFSYVATGPGGVSAPATVTVTVNVRPEAQSQSVLTPAVTPVSVVLSKDAVGGPFIGATVVFVSPVDAGTTSISLASGEPVLTFQPSASYFGLVRVGFTLSNANATTALANVDIFVEARQDAGLDSEVRGLVAAQAESARRFASAQVGNFQQRLERLHDDARPSVWVGGVGRNGAQDARDGSEKIDFNTQGISVGADVRLSDRLSLGGGLGYGSDRNDVGFNGSRAQGRVATAAIYASWQQDRGLFFDGVLGYQRLHYDLRRSLGGVGTRVTGERDGKQWFGSVSAGADMARGRLQFTPYGRVDVAHATLDPYSESGDPVRALRYQGLDLDSLSANLGLRLHFNHRVANGLLTPQLRLEYQHEFEDNQRTSMSYVDLPSGPVYTADIDAFDRTRFELGLGLVYASDRLFSTRLEYRGLIGGDDRDAGLMLHFERSF